MKYQDVIEEIHGEVQALFGAGHVADYIPTLAGVDPHQLGIAIETVDGRGFSIGNAEIPFSIQSISKVFNVTFGMRILGDRLFERVGVEPSGSAFNSLVQLEYEDGIPRNPFINAGALVVADILLDHLDDPTRELLLFVQKLCGEEVRCDDSTVVAEHETGFRNLALVHLMKAQGNINHAVDEVLDTYYHQCALEMTCKTLARSMLFLANGGIVPASGERVLTASQAKRINAIMLTCGFYDQAGEFAYRVGLPGKSGVGGGIVAVVPDQLVIAVWSPELNSYGNSVIGVEVLELFTTRTGRSVF